MISNQSSGLTAGTDNGGNHGSPHPSSRGNSCSLRLRNTASPTNNHPQLAINAENKLNTDRPRWCTLK
jgi:hypothetical protein